MRTVLIELLALDYWKLTTLVLALFAAYLAFQQYRLGRERFKLDLFEKRFKVFSGARIFLTQIMREGNLKDLNPLWEYRAAIGEATFLFDEDITAYLEEIYEHAVSLHVAGHTMEPLPVGDERTRLAGEISENLLWLSKQLPELTNRFSLYMKFKTWT
jgi:hypothetical protein